MEGPRLTKLRTWFPSNYLVNDGTRIESELHVTPKTLLLNTLLHFSKKPFVDFKILFDLGGRKEKQCTISSFSTTSFPGTSMVHLPVLNNESYRRINVDMNFQPTLATTTDYLLLINTSFLFPLSKSKGILPLPADRKVFCEASSGPWLERTSMYKDRSQRCACTEGKDLRERMDGLQEETSSL